MLNDFDISGDLGALYPRHNGAEPACPMYSFNGPSDIVWNAIASALHARGWSERQIKEWLQSRYARWAVEMDLGTALTAAATAYAASIELV